jgi:hypothetical protein
LLHPVNAIKALSIALFRAPSLKALAQATEASRRLSQQGFKNSKYIAEFDGKS